MEAVAKQAGVGTGTLYRHFPSKDDLIAALVEDLSDEVLASARAALAHQDGSGIWEFMQATGAIQADSQGLLGRLWREGRRPERVAAIREIITELVDDASPPRDAAARHRSARHHPDPARPSRRDRERDRHSATRRLEALPGARDPEPAPTARTK